MESQSFNNWQHITLGEVAEYLNGRAFKPSEWEKSGLPIIRIQNLNDESAEFNYSNKIFEDRYRVKNGDLLFAWSASLGAFIWKRGDAWLNQHIFKVEPKSIIDKKYLYYTLTKIISELYSKTHGSGMVHITKSKFETTPIYLPPLPEQHRIVEKIEELFSELDNGIANLKEAKEQLKVYRQSVLKWAFEGRLTNEEVKDGELPEGWRWVKIEDICDVVRGGSPRPAGDPRYYGGDIPFIKVADITKDDSMFLNSCEYTIKEAGLKKTRQIRPGTLLLTNSGATLGVPKICMINATMNDGIAAFLHLDERNKMYLYHYWKSKTKELRNIDQGAAQPNLNTTIIRNYYLPYCSFDEQNRIVEAIETRLSLADQMEQSIDESLRQAEALRQSILKSAFEGRIINP